MAQFYLSCDSFQASRIFELLIKTDHEADVEQFKTVMIKSNFTAPKCHALRFEGYVRSYFESVLPLEMASVQYQLMNFHPDLTPKLLTMKGNEIADNIKRVIEYSDMANEVLGRFSKMFLAGMMTHRILIYTTRGFVHNRYNLVSTN